MTTNLLLFAAFVFVMLLMSFNYSKKKKKVLFFGDSLTEQGVKAGGYISLLLSLIHAEGLDHKFDLVGAGISGNTVQDLSERLLRDVLSKGAEVIIIFIGVNDVWHRTEGSPLDIMRFTATYEEIIRQLLSAGIKIIVCTPAAIGERNNNPLDDDLDEVSEQILALAAKYELRTVDLRKTFRAYNALNNSENNYDGVLTTDGVHLNYRGNEVVARELWKVLKP